MSEIKNYDRFKELYKDKKYALAYAIAVKYTYLQLTPEYIQMEKNFQISYVNAQKLILLNLPDKAKNQINSQLSYTNIRAPFRGIITGKYINRGDTIKFISEFR